MKHEAPQGFDRFWNAYPKRVSRLDAIKAWKQIKPDAETVDAMLTALDWQRQQAQWKKDGGQFIPYPASWLRAGRWMDEPPAGLAPARSCTRCGAVPACRTMTECRDRILSARNGNGNGHSGHLPL